MGVFDRATRIQRAVADPKTDDTLPPSGALSWGVIVSPTALSGTSGADAKLVKGNQWDQVAGNMTENYTGNVKTTVLQNRTEMVTLKHEETVVAGFKQTVIGQYNRTILGPQMTSNIGPRNSTYVAPCIELVASARVLNGGPLYETKPFKGAVYGVEQKNVGASGSLYGKKVEMGFDKLDVANNQVVVCNIEGGFKGLENRAGGFSNVVEGFRNRMTGIQAGLRSFEANVGPDVQIPATKFLN